MSSIDSLPQLNGPKLHNMVSSIELPLPRNLNTRDSKMPPDLSEARKHSREHRKSKHLSNKEQKELFDQL